MVHDDVASDPTLTEAEKARHASIRVGATASVPLVKDGRLVAVLFMHHREAHAWTPDEISLLEAVAARTWDAVERARAEAALRDSEARLRTLFVAAERRAAELGAVLESTTDGVYIGGMEGITLANQPALDQLGFATPEELNRHVGTLAEEIQTREPVGVQVYLIMREAVRNAVKHSGCGRIGIRLEIGDEEVVGVVEDDGEGFDPEAAGEASPSWGVGLGSMRERAEMLGGTLVVDSRPGEGARVEVRVPLDGPP